MFSLWCKRNLPTPHRPYATFLVHLLMIQKALREPECCPSDSRILFYSTKRAARFWKKKNEAQKDSHGISATQEAQAGGQVTARSPGSQRALLSYRQQVTPPRPSWPFHGTQSPVFPETQGCEGLCLEDGGERVNPTPLPAISCPAGPDWEELGDYQQL